MKIISLLLPLSLMVGCNKVHWVDNGPSVAAGERFFAELKQSHAGSVSAYYSREFQVEHNKDWPELLSGLQQRFGPVTSVTLLESKIVPVDQVGCTLLRYKVNRGVFVTNENLLFRPENASGPSIIGHELFRLDTNQRIAAGLSVRESSINVP